MVKNGETGAPEAHAKDCRLIDLSHVIEDGMVTLKGFPAPLICDYLSREASRAIYAEGTEFHIGRIDMIANTGTYVDAPFHRYADGRDVSELPLEWVADLEGVVVRATERAGRGIGPEAFAQVDVVGKAVLVHTGHAAHWGTDAYFDDHPFLTRAAAEHLRDAGARLVGIDSLNIDDTGDGARPVHTVLLGADILVAEHLRGLEQLPDAGFRFYAVPVKVKGFGTFPVRAFAAVG
jgi:arylformamidase